MSAQNNAEMQYQSPAMQMSQAQLPSDSNVQEEQTNTTEQKPKRTFLGMRGGGICIDLCACFICCECMDGICHTIDDCCCC